MKEGHGSKIIYTTVDLGFLLNYCFLRDENSIK